MKFMDTKAITRFRQLFSSENNSLGVITHDIRLEYTINYPRTAAFVRLGTEGQKTLYLSLLKKMELDMCVHVKHIDHVYRFEQCKDGHVHAHGYMDCTLDQVRAIEGMIMQLVMSYMTQLPRRSAQWLTRTKYSHRYQCWKSPPILCQLRDKSDTERIKVWDQYINKEA